MNANNFENKYENKYENKFESNFENKLENKFEKDNKKEPEDLLRKIQELEFAAVDLNLFLDTHPEEKRALEDYNKVTRELMKCKEEYEQIHGPLTNFGCAPSQYPWKWISEPWPWECQ